MRKASCLRRMRMVVYFRCRFDDQKGRRHALERLHGFGARSSGGGFSTMTAFGA